MGRKAPGRGKERSKCPQSLGAESRGWRSLEEEYPRVDRDSPILLASGNPERPCLSFLYLCARQAPSPFEGREQISLQKMGT